MFSSVTLTSNIHQTWWKTITKSSAVGAMATMTLFITCALLLLFIWKTIFEDKMSMAFQSTKRIQIIAVSSMLLCVSFANLWSKRKKRRTKKKKNSNVTVWRQWRRKMTKKKNGWNVTRTKYLDIRNGERQSVEMNERERENSTLTNLKFRLD